MLSRGAHPVNFTYICIFQGSVELFSSTQFFIRYFTLPITLYMKRYISLKILRNSHSLFLIYIYHNTSNIVIQDYLNLLLLKQLKISLDIYFPFSYPSFPNQLFSSFILSTLNSQLSTGFNPQLSTVFKSPLYPQELFVTSQ